MLVLDCIIRKHCLKHSGIAEVRRKAVVFSNPPALLNGQMKLFRGGLQAVALFVNGIAETLRRLVKQLSRFLLPGLLLYLPFDFAETNRLPFLYPGELDDVKA